MAEVAAIAEVTLDEVKQVVAVFTAQEVSFLFASQTDTGETNLDISHESLIRNWARLNEWLDQEEQAYSHYESLVRSANEYNVGNGELLHGLGLQNALKWWRSESVPTSRAWTDRVVRDSYDMAERFLQLSEQKEQQVKEEARLKTVAEAEAKEREFLLAAEAKSQSERATIEATKAGTFRIMLWVTGGIAICAVGLLLLAFAAHRRARQAEIHANLNADRAVEEADRADTMLERAEHLFYASQVRTAEQSYGTDNADRCRDLLDTCRWDYRGIEHSELFERVRPWHSGSVWSVSFSPDGKQLVAGSGDSFFASRSEIKVWDGGRRRAMLPIVASSEPINAASVSRDETLIASGNAKGLVQVWDALSGQAMTNFEGHENSVETVAISPVVKPIQEKKDESNLDTPDRRHRIQQVASGSSDRTVRLWDLELGNRRVLNTTETKLDFDREQGVHRIAFSKNGRWIAAGGSSGLVRIWDTSTHELLDSFDAHAGFVKSLEFTDRDTALVTSGWAAERGPTEFRTWRFRDGKRIGSSGSELMPALPGNWHSGIAKHGNRIATGRSDGVLVVSDLGSETKPLLILAHPGRNAMNDLGEEVMMKTAIQAVAFSPDGKLLATAGADHSIQLWNPMTGERRAVLSEHTAAVNSLQFYRHKSRGKCDPDELRLLSSGSDGTVRVWLVDEILAHAPLPVPFKQLDQLPEIASETSETAASVDAEPVPEPLPQPETIPAATNSEPHVDQPPHGSTTQPSSQTSVAIFIGLLALFALFQTIASCRRKPGNVSSHSSEDPN